MYFLQAFKPIALDLLATIIFIGTYWATGNVVLATLVGVGIGIGRFTYMKYRGQPIGPLQYLSIILVIASGAGTLITKDPHFVQIKSSVVSVAVGVVMLRSNWMAPYLPPIVQENLDPGIIRWASRGWGILQIVLAAANAVIAFAFSLNVWAVYTSFVPTTALIGGFLIQYVIFRTLIRRNIRAKAVQPQAAASA